MRLPPVGTRVSLRYRLPAGSRPPLSDVVGVLEATAPEIRVTTRTGAVVRVSPRDVVAVRALTAVPVRTAQIRAVEHAAALAWPGTEQQWLDGWLLRAAGGHTHRANSAVPLAPGAAPAALPRIAAWYAERGLPAWLAVPDRLLRLPDGPAPAFESLVMVGPAAAAEPDPAVTLAPEPDAAWLELYRRPVPVPVLTAVCDGAVVFASIPGAAVGRAAVTTAPDGRRFVGIAAVRVAEDQRRRGHARRLCAALLAWGAARGAGEAYLQVEPDNTAARALYAGLGFVVQHTESYLRVPPAGGP
ncbi:N-acetyltransferase [uncultured Mycolicibacterium sp.]|uniref:N-acetylglutamate synthase, CG3035 family n=1 Tax=uncultured Mycolicibacterium sp. TaxID=2320817 RepID=UPI002617581A|nr:GNAT family N-acetyltransferase [uncultured Mycolicibacterium sp.]